MTAGPEEQHAVLEQFERFGARCRLYAPLYRQVTVAALHGEVHGIDFETPYNDVLDAWNTYLARYNHGRGVVLIGHSQGSKILARLITAQIDGTPLQKWLISAIIPGESIEVPAGRDVGGTFKHVRLCRTASQVSCVIAYSSYLATPPPDQSAHFGAADTPGYVDACVDPAALDGQPLLDDELPPLTSVGRSFGTAFIETQAQLRAACASNGRPYVPRDLARHRREQRGARPPVPGHPSEAARLGLAHLGHQPHLGQPRGPGRDGVKGLAGSPLTGTRGWGRVAPAALGGIDVSRIYRLVSRHETSIRSPW